MIQNQYSKSLDKSQRLNNLVCSMPSAAGIYRQSDKPKIYTNKTNNEVASSAAEH
jgi:hypothetical protein